MWQQVHGRLLARHAAIAPTSLSAHPATPPQPKQPQCPPVVLCLQEVCPASTCPDDLLASYCLAMARAEWLVREASNRRTEKEEQAVAPQAWAQFLAPVAARVAANARAIHRAWCSRLVVSKATPLSSTAGQDLTPQLAAQAVPPALPQPAKPAASQPGPRLPPEPSSQSHEPEGGHAARSVLEQSRRRTNSQPRRCHRCLLPPCRRSHRMPQEPLPPCWRRHQGGQGRRPDHLLADRLLRRAHPGNVRARLAHDTTSRSG